MVAAADGLHLVNTGASHKALVGVRDAVPRRFGTGARDVLGEVSMLGVCACRGDSILQNLGVLWAISFQEVFDGGQEVMRWLRTRGCSG